MINENNNLLKGQKMNNETANLRRIIGVLMTIVVIMAYYVGYFSSKLGFDAPLIPNFR